MNKKLLAIIIVGCCLLSGLLGILIGETFVPTKTERVEIPIFPYDSYHFGNVTAIIFENAIVVINSSGYVLNYTTFKRVTSPICDTIRIHDYLYGVAIDGRFTLIDLGK